MPARIRAARRCAPAVLSSAALTLAGCGGGGEPASGGNASGRAVFARACAACHSLVGNESRHTQGGDLLGYRMSRADLTSFTREMPLRRALTGAELRAVVTYVLSAQARYAHRSSFHLGSTG